MTLATVLDSERERQGITVYRLAIRAGMSTSRIHGIFTGDTPNPGILTVVAILTALGKSLSWLDRELKTG